METKQAARISTETATDTMMRAMTYFEDEVDCVIVITLNNDGQSGGLYSNARSEPEMQGMINMVLDTWYDGVDD